MAAKISFYKRFLLIVIFFILIFSGCSSMVYKSAFPTLSDGKYDSEFPYKGSSEELERIGESVERINCIAFYKTYVFNSGTDVKISDITEEFLEKNVNNVSYFDKTSSGTGTIIYSLNNKIALLTCAHVISFPDTIYSHFTDEKGKFTKYLESISIRDRQMIYVAGLPYGGEVELLAIDNEHDLAVLGHTYPSLQDLNFPVFPYPKGEAKQLEWGTFVYVFGYPMNYKMVSKAIVSSPNMDGHGSFLIDAVVNKGFSGGIVLGIRDGIPNFEFVGIIRSIPEESEYVLEPEKLKGNINYSSVVPYKGDVYAIEKEDLKYGIAKVIPIDVIEEFLNANKEKLSDLGYDIDKFF
ncbi:MAG: serine protease [Ignavibacteriaceae bacterium]